MSAERGKALDPWESFLERPQAAFGAPPQRSRAADLLPQIAAERLAQGPPDADVARWKSTLRDQVWPSLVERQAGAIGHGWRELVSAVAVVIELVFGDLPADMAAHLNTHPSIRSQFDLRRTRWQRFALLVEHRAIPVRMLASTPATEASTEARAQLFRAQLDSARYWLGGVKPDGRSHTLMLALLMLQQRGILALPESGPVAATGAVGDDGDTLLPVRSVLEKMRSWFETMPPGLLVTSPMPRKDLSELRAKWAKVAGATDSQAVLLRDEPPLDSWITAGSLEEARIKLSQWSASRAHQGEREISSWDGERLEPDQLLQWHLDDETSRPLDSELARREDPVLRTCMRLFAADDRAHSEHGAIVYGPPGAGKSTLAKIIERRFTVGLCGALGLAVRRGARELAEAIHDAPDADLRELLARRAPELASAYRILIEQRRLLLIIDGLDEIDATAITALGRVLRRSSVLFFATSRELKRSLPTFPSHCSLRIRPPREPSVRLFLQRQGRSDLAEQLVLDPLGAWRSQSDPVQALCATPFLLALLCRVVKRGEILNDMDPFELYRRAFDGILAQAVADARLAPEHAELLRRQGALLAGELALAWLLSPRGSLDAAEIAAHLESLGLRGLAAVSVQRALEFGHLLTPGAGNHEFSHRTIAEWAAAGALLRKVQTRRLRAARSARQDVDLAKVEQRELDGVLPDRGPIHESTIWQMLIFYARSSAAPLALIERIVRSARFDSRPQEMSRIDKIIDPVARAWSRLSEALEGALELASRVGWRDPEEARAAWGIFVRASLRPRGDERGQPLIGVGSGADRSRERFVRAVASYLPTTLSGLINVAARHGSECAELRADPSKLLPFCPGGHLMLFDSMLRDGTPGQKREILERYAACGVEMPTKLVNNLAVAVMRETRKQARKKPGLTRVGRSEEELLEEALFAASVRLGQELPWPTVRRRLIEWPWHLRKVFLAWFEDRPGLESSHLSDRRADPPPRARRLLALLLLLNRLAAGELELLGRLRVLAASPQASELAVLVRERIRWSDEPARERLFEQIAKRAGLPSPVQRPAGREAGLEEDTNPSQEAFHTYHKRYEQVSMVLRHIARNERFDETMEELWENLTGRGAERGALIDVLVEMRRVPPYVTSREIAARAGSSAVEEQLAPRPNPGSSSPPSRKAHFLSIEGPEAPHAITRHLRPALSSTGDDSHLRDGVDPSSPGDLQKLLDRDAPPRLTITEALGFEVPLFERLVTELGSAVNAPLLAALRRRRGELKRVREASEAREQSVNWPPTDGRRAEHERRSALQAWMDLLRWAVLESTDASITPMARIVELLFEVLPGDRREIVYPTTIEVTSAPDDDEPVIEEIEDDDPEEDTGPREALSDGRALDAGKTLLRLRLSQHPNEAPELERLLEHPSEILQATAYEELAGRFPGAVADLSLRAINAHLRFTRTTRAGAPPLTSILLGLQGSGGYGLPEIGEPLRRALEHHFASAPRNFLMTLLQHYASPVRKLACEWLAERGDARDTPMLRSVLGDPDLHVFTAALRTCLELNETAFAAELDACGRSRWTLAHYALLLEQVSSPRPGIGRGVEKRRGLFDILPRALISDCMAEAIGLLRAADASTVSRSPLVMGAVPSLLEKVVCELDQGAEHPSRRPLSNQMLFRMAKDAPEPLRAALYRILVRRRARGIRDALVSLLKSKRPPERFMAAEGLMALGAVDLLAPIQRTWRLAMSLRADAWNDLSAPYHRLAWALWRAPSQFAPLLIHLIHELPTDLEWDEPDWEGRQRLRKARRILRRWGDAGASPLLDLLERDPETQTAQHARSLVLRVYRRSQGVLRELRRRAKRNDAMVELLTELERPTKKQLAARVVQEALDRILPASP